MKGKDIPTQHRYQHGCAGSARDPLNKLAILILSIWASNNNSHIQDA